MIEDYLITYGPLGCWTAWLLFEKTKMLSAFQNILKENTKALLELKNCVKGGERK